MEREGGLICTVIAANVRLYREGIELFLEGVSGIEVLGSAFSAEETIAVVEARKPHVLLIDIAMPAALETIRELATREHNPNIVALTVPDTEADFLRCVRAGISGYVAREGSLGELVQAIRDAHTGELHCSPKDAGRLLRQLSPGTAEEQQDPLLDQLTVRERDVLHKLEVGRSNKEIASALHIEVTTVKHHVHNLLTKLSVENRGEAAAMARRLERRTSES